MKIKAQFGKVLFMILTLVNSRDVWAHTDPQKLAATILHLNSAFWNAYNNCDTAHFKDFVTNNVEFYHDKGGVTINANSLIDALDKNICGNINSRVRREAVAGTVKVYPMQKGNEIYGSLISGEHLFYLTEKDKPC